MLYYDNGTNYGTLSHVMNDNYTRCRNLGDTRGTWRAPNLRELFLMSTCGILEHNETARTEFKFSTSSLPNTNSMYRRGWHYDQGIITMGNGSLTEGNAIRCVRDNN